MYNAMEHFRVDVIIGQGAGAKSVNLPLNPFTLIGATTKSGMISAPLRSRFGITERLDFYTDEELRDIVLQSARYLKIKISDTSLHCASANVHEEHRALQKNFSVACVMSHRSNIYDEIDEAIVQEALTFLGIDEEGLTKVDHMILQKMIEHCNGGPLGVETIAALVGEDKDTIESVYEPFLLRKGYLEKTPRGRQIPAKRLAKLRSELDGQQSLL